MAAVYQEIIQKDRGFLRSEECRHNFRMGFLIADAFISVLAVGGFCIVRWTDSVTPRSSNVTRLCSDPSYNVTTISQPSYDIATYASVTISVALYFVLLIGICKIVKHRSLKQIRNTVLWNAWILVSHLALLYLLVDFLKCAAAVPRPYYFTIPNITSYYCESGWKKRPLTLDLENLNNILRKSFPSYRSAIYSYCVTFMYLYFDHFDTTIGVRALQETVILTMGSYLSYCQFRLWDDGVNHLSDLLVGSVIGIIQAMSTVRSMYGSVFNSRKIIFVKA